MQRKWFWTAVLALPLLAVGGLVYAAGQAGDRGDEAGIVCPITGEELPCPQCCPLN